MNEERVSGRTKVQKAAGRPVRFPLLELAPSLLFHSALGMDYSGCTRGSTTETSIALTVLLFNYLLF